MLKRFYVIIFLGLVVLLLSGCQDSKSEKKEDISDAEIAYTKYIEEDSKILENYNVELIDLDGKNKNFTFEYNGENFSALFSNGSWKIIDSYKIKNREDIKKICEALIEKNQVKGKDGLSYRTAEDMTYEWIQHNIAYELLPDDNSWKIHAKNVDLDPADQGKNLKEIFESRIGKKISIKNILTEFK